MFRSNVLFLAISLFINSAFSQVFTCRNQDIENYSYKLDRNTKTSTLIFTTLFDNQLESVETFSKSNIKFITSNNISVFSTGPSDKGKNNISLDLETITADQRVASKNVLGTITYNNIYIDVSCDYADLE